MRMTGTVESFSFAENLCGICSAG